MLKIPVYFDSDDYNSMNHNSIDLDHAAIHEIYTADVLDITPYFNENYERQKGCRFKTASKECYITPLETHELAALVDTYVADFYPESNLKNNNKDDNQTI